MQGVALHSSLRKEKDNMKISSFNSDVENISKLSDRPNIENGYTSHALKALFDNSGVDIKDYINNTLIEELMATEAENSGADRIGSAPIDTLPGNTVQEKLISVSEQINGLANATIPDGSITPEKFSPDIQAFLTSASLRGDFFTEPGMFDYTPHKDGMYKITLVGAGAGGGINPNAINIKFGGGSGAVCIKWMELYTTDVCKINIGAGGKGLVAREEGSLISHATSGGSTVFFVNDVIEGYADGGKIGVSARGKAAGGQINIKGGFPKAGDIYGTTNGRIEFPIGADTCFGRGGGFADDEAGIGAGGYAGEYQGSGIYVSGYDGGNGFGVIEYIG